MKIEIKRLPDNKPISLLETEDPRGLDLDVPGIKLVSPIEIRADVIKIQGVVDIKINLKSQAVMQCSRCLTDITADIERNFRLDYSISAQDKAIDITDDARQEIILKYPLKPLCKSSCKGLCLKCGKDLNAGDCGCKV